MTPELTKLIAKQIKATAKALTAQLMAQSVREEDPTAFIFTALGRLRELSPADGSIESLEAGLNQFAREYALEVPSLAGSDTSTPHAGWVQ